MGVTADSNLRVDGSIATLVASPAAMALVENDYAGADGRSFARLTPFALGTTITGFASGTDGRQLVVVNLGNAAVTIAHQNAGSANSNRVITKVAVDTVIPVDGTMTLIYDAVTARWRQTG